MNNQGNVSYMPPHQRFFQQSDFPNAPENVFVPTIPLNQTIVLKKESNILQKTVEWIYDFAQFGKIGCHLWMGITHINYSSMRSTNVYNDFLYKKLLSDHSWFKYALNGINIGTSILNFFFDLKTQERKRPDPTPIFESMLTNITYGSILSIFLASHDVTTIVNFCSAYGMTHIFIALRLLSHYSFGDNPVTMIFKKLGKCVPHINITFAENE